MNVFLVFRELIQKKNFEIIAFFGFSIFIFVFFYTILSMNGLVLGNDPAVHLQRANSFLSSGNIPISDIAWYPPLYHIFLSTLIAFTGASGIGKSYFGTYTHRRRELENQKLAAGNDDNLFPQWDFIGELIIDTRDVDFDEEGYGVEIISSSVIPLKGNVKDEMLYQESLNKVDLVSMLGLEHLDECDVDVGVFRYVFGIMYLAGGVDIVLDMNEAAGEDTREWDNNSYELISRQKYDFKDEEYVTREDDEDVTEELFQFTTAS